MNHRTRRLLGSLMLLTAIASAGVIFRRQPVPEPEVHAPILTMVQIPPGEFAMGAQENERCAEMEEESPRHPVRITRALLLSSTEITQSQFAEVMGRNTPAPPEARHPAAFVSWYDALEFCNRLSQRENLMPCYVRNGMEAECDFSASGYRLPTEAEWEYACRAGTTGVFNTGDSLPGCQERTVSESLEAAGWYRMNADGGSRPVGQKQPNAWGLFDMHGNVWEWCWDRYTWYEASLAIDPAGPPSGSTSRVLRGGSWEMFAGDCRSARRFAAPPRSKDKDYGFRVARTAPAASVNEAAIPH